jgi:hypothetical protein
MTDVADAGTPRWHETRGRLEVHDLIALRTASYDVPARFDVPIPRLS